MSWQITLVKGLKFFVVTLVVTLLASLTPEAITGALAQIPYASFWAPAVVPALVGLVGAAINAIKHWNDKP